MARIYEIASKAEYIQDVARGIQAGLVVENMPQDLIDEIYGKLCDIAVALDEYHDWGGEDDK